VAGDLFSELSRPDELRASVEHLAEVFQPFLLDGGTIVALTGNHDNENFCRTMGRSCARGSGNGPLSARVLPAVSTWLQPTFFRLTDREGQEVSCSDALPDTEPLPG
jgi:hypothetical protein